MGNEEKKRIDPSAFGMEQIDDFTEVPNEWKPKGYKDVKAKDGKNYRIFRFGRPNEPDIELFEHSVEERGGRLYVRSDHMERQDQQARKKA